jgi:hypothetical protein
MYSAACNAKNGFSGGLGNRRSWPVAGGRSGLFFWRPTTARAGRYREFAAEAEQAAKTIPFEEFRDQYRMLARQWNDMAADLEASCGLA